MLPRHTLIPDPITGYALNPERGWVSVYLPSGTTNLLRNPSFERDVTTDWTEVSDGSGTAALARTADAQFRGAWCAELTIRTGGTYAQIENLVDATVGTVYAFQAHFRRAGAADVAPGSVYAAIDSTIVPWQRLVYVADGWWRGEIVYRATGSSPVGVRFTGSPGQICYVDALQWEAQSECSTYCDGDELGLIAGEMPPPFAWNGAPHASTSTRTATTRAGGLRRNLADYGLQVVGLVGLGQPPQQNQTIPYAGQDGSFYQGARRPERPFTIAGAFSATTPIELDRQRRDVRSALTYDRTGADSPIVLELQAHRGAVAIGEAVACVCSYTGGLEANQASLYSEKVAVQFVEHAPGLEGLASRGAEIAYVAPIDSPYLTARDDRTGVWAEITSSFNGVINPNAVVFGPDERLYVGGFFTTPYTRVAAYNFQSGAWEAIGSGLSATVRALAFDRLGRLWAGGASGLITGSTVARWDGSSWSAVGTLTATVYALAYDAINDMMYVGGQTGSNAALYRNGGSTAITTATTGIVRDLVFDQLNSTLYIGGQFTNLAGVSGATNIATYEPGGSVTAIGTGATSGGGTGVYSVTVDRQGRVWLVGDFANVNGVTAFGIARIVNGVAEAVPGVSLDTDSDVNVAVQAHPIRDEVWASAVSVPTQSGPTAAGLGWVQVLTEAGPLWPPGMAIPCTNVDYTLAFAFSPARAVFLRNFGATDLRPAHTATLDNPGTLAAPLVVQQWLQYTLDVSGEVITWMAIQGPTAVVDVATVTYWPSDSIAVDARQLALAVQSAVQGDLRRTMRQGSELPGLVLPPGEQTVNLLALGTANTAWQRWAWFRPRYGALGDAVR